MYCHLSRTYPSPTHARPPRVAFHTNLAPGRANRIDRETIGCWFIDVHVYPFRLELIGPWPPRCRRSTEAHR